MRVIVYAGALLAAPVVATLAFGVWSAFVGERDHAPATPVTTQPARAQVAEAPAENPDWKSARGACVLSIPANMHDPGSVDFIGLTSSWPVSPGAAASTYDVLVPLRARNPLGALVQQTLRCTVRREAGGWRLVGLSAAQ